MYALTFSIYRGAASVIYASLADTYNLPSVATLVAAIGNEVEWRCDASTQVFYIDNLREANRRDVFEIRFKTNPHRSVHLCRVPAGSA